MSKLPCARLALYFEFFLRTDKGCGSTTVCVESTVPLLDIPAKILEKYRGMAEGDRLLPVPCYVASTLRANASKRDTTAVRGERGSMFANRPLITDDSGPERSDASDIVGSGGIKGVMPVARDADLTS